MAFYKSSLYDLCTIWCCSTQPAFVARDAMSCFHVLLSHCHISRFIKSRLSSLSIKQRNRDWVTLSCKREELWIFNKKAHFHCNNTFLCLAYYFQIWKKWIYLTLGSLHIIALYTAQSTHDSIWQTFRMLHMPYEI